MNGRAELFRALGAATEPPVPTLGHVTRALDLPPLPDRAEHSETFLFQLYPYAAVYVGAEGMLGGEAADRVAGFWGALGATPSAEPDHLSALLGLYGGLLDAEAEEQVEAHRRMRREARRALLWEHLLSWLPVYLDKLDDIGTDFYREWGRLLRSALYAEAEEVGLPDRLPLHLRSVPGMPPAEADAAELLPAILAPARSGIVLTRSDLTRAARTIGVALRMGERRFILETMLSQDARSTLGWLVAESLEWEHRHRQREPVLGPIARHWAERAAAVAVFFASSHEAAGEVVEHGAGR